MNNLLKFLWLPMLSGIFIGTSYIPFPPWASLFGFVPLWLFWTRQSTFKNVLIGGLTTAFVFTLIGFNWMAYLLHEFAHLDWPYAIVGLLVYALIAHLFVPVAGLLWFWGQRTWRWPAGLSLAMLCIITILCEAYSVTLFYWNFGYSWYGAGVPLYHCAEIIGFKGLSALTLACNLPLYWAWQSRRQTSGKVIFAAVVAVFGLLNLGGIALKARLPAPDASLNVLMAQASVGNSEKLAAELKQGYRAEILRRYMTLTNDALIANADTHIDFALWPETAFPALLGERFKNDPMPTALAKFLQTRQLPLITGAYSVDSDSRLVSNSLFVLDKNGGIVPPHYSKTILLAFGEYIPGEETFPQIRQWLPATGHFGRGKGPTELLQLDDFKIGAQICYESLFPEFSKDLAQLGAQFIVNVTNDAWYGDWQEPYQHMYMTLARGVEFRRPVLRVTNSGISTASLASGEVLALSPIYQPWAGVLKVPYLKNPPSTFYQRTFWLVPGLLWGILGVLLWIGFKGRQQI
ncbi:apolipoprotein N-acyltransferase [Methylosoma difficile]